MSDSLVEKSREVREQLLQELGGIDGLCDKLEDMDRDREQQSAARKKSTRRSTQVGQSLQTLPTKRAAAR